MQALFVMFVMYLETADVIHFAHGSFRLLTTVAVISENCVFVRKLVPVNLFDVYVFC